MEWPHISFSTAERLRLPWRLHGLPAGLVATSSQVIEDPAYQPWSAELAFVNPRWPSQVALVVRSDRFGYELHDDFQPQSHVHGLPATVTAEVSGATLIARDAGVTHSLYVAAPEPLGSLGPGGVAGLFARFDLLGEPAEWTDHPLD